MSYVSSIELRKIRPEVVKYVYGRIVHQIFFVHSSERGVLESVVNLFHDVVDRVPQVIFALLIN